MFITFMNKIHFYGLPKQTTLLSLYNVQELSDEKSQMKVS